MDKNHRKITSQRGDIHYWVEGQGRDCILFTHGATMDHGLFRYQVEYFSKNFKVINWDVPAHGLSRPYRDFSMLGAARELVKILDAESVKKAHLVGQSMGGYIGQLAGLEFPERVLSLTAVDSSPIQTSYYSALDNWLLSITPALLRLYPYGYLVNLISKQIALRQEAQSYALETLQNLTKDEITKIMGAVYGGFENILRDFRLPMPILIVYGAADRTGKVQSYCNEWARRENHPLKVIPDAAHNANMDNPEAFNKILTEFLVSL